MIRHHPSPVPRRRSMPDRGIPVGQKGPASQNEVFDAISYGPAARSWRRMKLAIRQSRCEFFEVGFNCRDRLHAGAEVETMSYCDHSLVDARIPANKYH